MTKHDFFAKAISAALAAGHIFPEYAVCEAALESAWGESQLAHQANNLFGQKAGFTEAKAETIQLQTREFLHGHWFTVPALWPKFADWTESFKARMELLRGSHLYANAMDAENGEQFVTCVSKVWSTDPHRSYTVLLIFRQNQGLIEAVEPQATAAAGE